MAARQRVYLTYGRRVVDGRQCGLSDAVIEWSHTVFAGSSDPAQDAFDYILAVLSAPAYAVRYWPALEASKPTLPLSDDPLLAADAASLWPEGPARVATQGPHYRTEVGGSGPHTVG